MGVMNLNIKPYFFATQQKYSTMNMAPATSLLSAYMYSTDNNNNMTQHKY